MKYYSMQISNCNDCIFFERVAPFVYMCTHLGKKRLLNLKHFQSEIAKDCPLPDVPNKTFNLTKAEGVFK